MVVKAYSRLNDLLALKSSLLLKDKEEAVSLASLYMALEGELKWLEEMHYLLKKQSEILHAKENILSCIQTVTTLYLDLIKKPHLGNPRDRKSVV